MIKNFLYIALGGAVGSVLRYAISLLFRNTQNFPWATFIVNLLGSFLIGLIFGYISKNSTISTSTTLFLTVGLCGGFTTFSTFSKESLQLIQIGNYWGASFYIAGSVILGILLAAFGYFLVK